MNRRKTGEAKPSSVTSFKKEEKKQTKETRNSSSVSRE
jgi:hypothetical protein